MYAEAPRVASALFIANDHEEKDDEDEDKDEEEEGNEDEEADEDEDEGGSEGGATLLTVPVVMQRALSLGVAVQV
jgi:hypothetical protein